VLEVGTAIGVVSMTAALIVGVGSVVTFDANPDIVADAQANFRRNGLAGISGRTGVLTCRRRFVRDAGVDFFVARDFWASRLDAKADDADIVKVVRVPRLCLEAEIAAYRATVLICDIEGGEVDLLSGAELDGIRLIIMETHYGVVGEGPTDAMIRELILQGFAFHLGASGGHMAVLRR
jgi:FkbM family methyltransferase